jgi:hypothetical protein
VGIDEKEANLLSSFPLFVIRRVIIREDPQGVSEYIADYIISMFFFPPGSRYIITSNPPGVHV